MTTFEVILIVEVGIIAFCNLIGFTGWRGRP